MGRVNGVLSWVLGVWRWEWEECLGSDIRGWDAPGVGPALPSDLASRCPTGRDVYLRRRAGIGLVSGPMRAGARVHEEALGVWRSVVASGREGLLESLGRVSSVGGLWAVSSAFRWLQVRKVLPVLVEPLLPGWAGVSSARPDLVFGVVPVELVNSRPGSPSWDRKRLVLAVYGMVLEFVHGVPVDYGFVVSLSEGVVEPVCLEDGLRLAALREVQRLGLALASDPGLPSSPEECPRSCPFRGECWGGRVEVGRGEARLEVGAEAGAG